MWTGKLLNKHKLFGHVYMIFLIPLTWTVFAVNDITQLGILFTRLFPFFGKGAWSVFRYDYLKYLGQYYLFFIAGIFLSTTLPYKLLKKVKSKVLLTAFLLIILGGSLYCMYRGFDDPFLYFRFWEVFIVFVNKKILIDSPWHITADLVSLLFWCSYSIMNADQPHFPPEIWSGNSAPLLLPTLRHRIRFLLFSKRGTAFFHSHLFII